MQSPLKDEFLNDTPRRRLHAHLDDKKQEEYNIRRNWRLFQATDFQSLMYPCFTFCRILGIFPYRINNSTFEASQSCYILSTNVICFFCIYGIIILYELDVSGVFIYISVPRSLERHSYYVLGSFIMILTYVLRRPRLLLLQTILEVSSKLSSESYKKLSWLIHVKDISGFLYIIVIGIICCIKMPLKDASNLLTIFSTYLTLLLFQMDMMYMNFVCVLKVCFRRINDNLTKMQQLVLSDKPHLLRRIYHDQRNPFLLMKLKALKEQHLMVSDTVQMLNTIFGLQIIVTIVISFVEITFHLYFYIILSMGEQEDFWYSFYIMSVIYYITKIILIVWACDSGKSQAAKIGITVHDLLNSISDRQIKDELELFSMQILHRENVFSAKGLTLDATLLTAMVGSITTYLLILIQFLVTSHSCDGKDISNNSTK